MQKLLSNYFRSYQYIRGMMKSDEAVPFDRYVINETYSGLNNEDVPLRIYNPIKSKGQSVILFPGASPYAEEHPTINKLAFALSQTGCRVFLPRIPPLKELEISENNINWVAHCYSELFKHPSIQKENLLVVGISYGGGLLLKASLDKRISNTPPKLYLVYGTYYSIETAFKFLMSGEIYFKNSIRKITPNPWGSVVLFYNYLLSVDNNNNNRFLTKILKLRIEDKFELVDEMIDTLPNEEKEFIRDILDANMSERVLRYSQIILNNNREKFLSLSPKYWCKKIKDKVYILHGANDSMVPFTESTSLAKDLPNSELLISYLYEHKEISTNKGVCSKIKEVFKLIHFFAQLFGYNED